MAGYSRTPLVTKLGIKEGAEAYIVGAPEDYLELVAPVPEGVTFAKRPTAQTAFVHHFTTRAAELGQALVAYRAKLGPEVMVWVSWPKKSAKVPTVGLTLGPQPGATASILHKRVIRVAIEPALAALGRGDHRVAARAGVVARMLVGRAVAAEGGAARLAGP